jgi:hypothetical protein
MVLPIVTRALGPPVRPFGVYTGTAGYDFDGVRVLPVETFLRELWAGSVY